MATSTQEWARRLRRVRRSPPTNSNVQEPEPSSRVVTVDLCTTIIEDDTSCIDLTCEADEEVVDLTSVNDTSVMVLGSARSDGRGLRTPKRRRLLARQNTESSHGGDDDDDDSYELPDLPSLNERISSSTSRSKPSTKQDTPLSKKIFCPVCLDDYNAIQNSDRQLVSTICGHLFCDSCIQESIRGHHCCPTCRKKLTLKKFHPIFI